MGRLFHRVGPTTSKALVPPSSRVLGIRRRDLFPDLNSQFDVQYMGEVNPINKLSQDYLKICILVTSYSCHVL